MGKLPHAADHRRPDHPIDPIFHHRWSPRAMSGEPLAESDLLTIFEAARWAPSTYNEQEWRFLYAHRDTPHWPTFFGLLTESNQQWCHKASALVVVVSHTVFSRNGKPNPVHTFDAGAAWENAALQGSSMGLVMHGMMGFDFERARTALAIPADYAVNAMFAIGHPGDPDELAEHFRKMEVPSGRKPVREILCEGKFNFS